MRLAGSICMVAAAVIFAAGPIAALCLWVSASFDRKADERRRAEQDRDVTPEWLALLAAVEPTPVYDALVCEQIERAEGWAS